MLSSSIFRCARSSRTTFNEKTITSLFKNIQNQQKCIIPSGSTTYFLPNKICNRFASTSQWLQQQTATAPHTPIKEQKQQELIYYGTLTPKIRAVKVFSLTTSIVGLLVQPMLIEQGSKLGGTPMVIFLCGFAGFFTFVTPLFLHFITKKYVSEIHYNAAQQQYTATTISFLLMKNEVRSKTIFKEI